MEKLILEAKEKFDKTISSLKENFAIIRTGRANPNMLNRVHVDYYGEKVPVNQIASITSPEPRQILIKPYDRNDIKKIAIAVGTSNLNVNPAIDDSQIRIIFPPLTEETRKNIVKQAKQMSEDAKIALRNIRHDYLTLIKEDESLSDDLKERIEKDFSKVFEETNQIIDDLFESKEKEILTI